MELQTVSAPVPALLPTAPSLALLGIEPLRAALEYAGMRLMNRRGLPTGDGHPVVLFPGLASGKRAVAPLAAFCEELGYKAYDWGRGVNAGPKGDIDLWLDELAVDIDKLTASHDGQVSLVGWSLGGIYAREVAKRLESRVRRVITIGSPFADAERTNVGLLYRWVNGGRPVLAADLAARLRCPPVAPTTSIYSRSDGVVAWQACIQDGEATHCENVEVQGSHCGLVWNIEVMAIIAHRLNQAVKPAKAPKKPRRRTH